MTAAMTIKDIVANLDSRDWRLVEIDPVTGVKRYEADLPDGLTVVRTEYYMLPDLLDANQAIANHNDGKRWGDGQIAASIPLPMFYRELVPALKQGDRRYIKRFLNDSDNAGLRTFRGHI
jgi:hypothetical protein